MNQSIVLYPLLAAVLYYLGALAKVTEFIWSRYPARLNTFMLCAACSGTWYAAGVGAAFGYGLHWNFMGLPGDRWTTVVTVALYGCFTVPLFALAHLKALDLLHVMLHPTPETEDVPPAEPWHLPQTAPSEPLLQALADRAARGARGPLGRHGRAPTVRAAGVHRLSDLLENIRSRGVEINPTHRHDPSNTPNLEERWTAYQDRLDAEDVALTDPRAVFWAQHAAQPEIEDAECEEPPVQKPATRRGLGNVPSEVWERRAAALKAEGLEEDDLGNIVPIKVPDVNPGATTDGGFGGGAA